MKNTVDKNEQRNKVIDDLASRFKNHETPLIPPIAQEKTPPTSPKKEYIRKTWFCSKDTIRVLNKGYLHYLSHHNLDPAINDDVYLSRNENGHSPHQAVD